MLIKLDKLITQSTNQPISQYLTRFLHTSAFFYTCSPNVSDFFQKLEESVLSEEKRLTVRGPSPDAPPTCIPARVREIVTKNLNESVSLSLSVSGGSMSSVLSLQEENRVLQGELGRLEDLLAHSRADRDELAIKYSAISERLEQALRLETGDGDRDCAESRSLAQQNVDLRRRLEEEQAAYKRKLTAYQEGQQRQAQLVQKLQAKVLQYKKKCSDLEQSLLERSSDMDQNRLSVSNLRYPARIHRCIINDSRSSSLSAVNAMLREQLEQASLANEALSQDIRRLTADWTKAREELEQREADWRREEESFHNYFSSEHSRLLALWRQVVGFRRSVCELKSATERLEAANVHILVCTKIHCILNLTYFSTLEVRGRLQSAQSSLQQLRKQLAEAESGRREAELRVQAMQGERDDAQRERETAVKERDRMRQEREKINSVLAQTTKYNAELTVLVAKLHSEEAALRDSLAKMGGMNESLAQDKSDLNSIIIQLEEEKSVLLTQRREAEQEKLTIRDELVRLEQDRLELDTARLALHQQLQESELLRAGLEAELQMIKADRQKLQEKVTQLCGEVSSLGAELGMVRGEGERQGVALEEAGRSRAELARERAGLVVQLTASERENAALTEELTALRSEREMLEASLFEVQQQLVQLESRREQIETENNSLRLRSETSTGIQNTQQQCYYIIKKRAGLKQALADAQQEAQTALRNVLNDHQEELERLASEKVRRQCEEKEQRLTVQDETLASAQKEVGELRSCLREVERSRLEARRELQELRRQVKVVDGEREQKGREVAELQARLSLEEQREEERGKELFSLKQRLAEAEAGRNSLRKELTSLQKRLCDSECVWRGCERDLAAQLQEARGCEKKLQDEARNLSLRAQTAADASAQIQLQLSEAEGRLAATEAELTRSEAGRRDLEFRLISLQSALTRTLGISAGGRASRGRSPIGSSHSSLASGVVLRRRSVSPLRCSLSPPKGEECSREATCVCVCVCVGKRGVDSRLSSTQAMLQQQEECVRRGERERRALTERVNELERTLQNCVTSLTQEQCSKLRAGEVRLEAERRRLREALEGAESRATRVELGRRSLEGEIQRLRVCITERETEAQTAQERHESMLKQVVDAESRVAALQREMDRLTAVLCKVQDAECVQREKAQTVSLTLQETAAAHSATQGRLATLQKSLSTAEQDRRLLQVRTSVQFLFPQLSFRTKKFLLEINVVERQKLKTEESSMRLSAERGRLDLSLNTAEQELQDAQRQISLLQAQLVEMEASHTASEQSARQRDDAQREVERLRANQREAERTLAARERAHRQRVKGLEEQVLNMEDRPSTLTRFPVPAGGVFQVL
uniref:Ciliary rootlet coiled-coil, rootletin n=1 Tax=Astyanax mexicanus TaxID=7994 RepID=A0A8B9RJA6_ASTMX